MFHILPFMPESPSHNNHTSTLINPTPLPLVVRLKCMHEGLSIPINDHLFIVWILQYISYSDWPVQIQGGRTGNQVAQLCCRVQNHKATWISLLRQDMWRTGLAVGNHPKAGNVLSEQTNSMVSLWVWGPQQSVEQRDYQFDLPESLLWLLYFAL